MVIAAAMVKKVFKNLDIKSGLANAISSLDKFALKEFNQLFHNCKVSGPLIASFLLGLPDYYSPTIVVKTINIAF